VRVRVHRGDEVSGGSHETARMLAHFSPYVAALAALAGLKNRALTHFQTAPLGVRATDSRKPGSALVVSLGHSTCTHWPASGDVRFVVGFEQQQHSQLSGFVRSVNSGG
jgi:hypothetical protein